ncbi:hypothetical protein GF367_04250 [Candidatus Woesearchaeota archaeon]|nr:hypothetical protein [Candidatus Woesearchaeota archaeon]
MDHSPTLKTVLMVEQTLRAAGKTVSFAALKRRLPRKVQHSTLKRIVAYLENNRKVVTSMRGITWDPYQDVSMELHELVIQKSFYHG